MADSLSVNVSSGSNALYFSGNLVGADSSYTRTRRMVVIVNGTSYISSETTGTSFFVGVTGLSSNTRYGWTATAQYLAYGTWRDDVVSSGYSYTDSSSSGGGGGSGADAWAYEFY